MARVDRTGCVLLDDLGDTLAPVRGRLMSRGKTLGDALVVGDRVRYEAGGSPTVVEVEPRRNAFHRRAAGGRAVKQVLAANLDQVALVASVTHPEFKPGFADRVFAQVDACGIPGRLVLTKLDLADRDAASRLLAAYARAGYPGHLVSARTREGVDVLRAALHGRRTLLVGHSGVGKSTLLNALVPGLETLVGHVNPKTGKGRHTTSAALLVRPGPGLEIIDTPGMRAFGLWGIAARDLERAYPEFRPHLGRCRFADCRHAAEPDCALRAAVAHGDIADRRFESFLKLRAELEAEGPRA